MNTPESEGAKCGTCGDLGVTAEGWCVDCDWRTNGVKVAMAYRLRSAPNAPNVSDDAMRRFWLNEGGTFHGPNVEHGTMTEAKLLPLLRRLRAGALLPNTPGEAKPCPDCSLPNNQESVK